VKESHVTVVDLLLGEGMDAFRPVPSGHQMATGRVSEDELDGRWRCVHIRSGQNGRLQHRPGTLPDQNARVVDLNRPLVIHRPDADEQSGRKTFLVTGQCDEFQRVVGFFAAVVPVDDLLLAQLLVAKPLMDSGLSGSPDVLSWIKP